MLSDAIAPYQRETRFSLHVLAAVFNSDPKIPKLEIRGVNIPQLPKRPAVVVDWWWHSEVCMITLTPLFCVLDQKRTEPSTLHVSMIAKPSLLSTTMSGRTER